MHNWLRELETIVARNERGGIDRILRAAVPDYRKEAV